MVHRRRANPRLDLSPVLVRDIDDGTVATLLGIGLKLDDLAIAPARFGHGVSLLRLPGRILFDRRALPYYGDVLGRLGTDARKPRFQESHLQVSPAFASHQSGDIRRIIEVFQWLSSEDHQAE
jgi:hypothetical protein